MFGCIGEAWPGLGLVLDVVLRYAIYTDTQYLNLTAGINLWNFSQQEN